MRSSLVCFFCKRRKIKCDKGNPCSACVKYNESVCEYEAVQENQNNGTVSVGAYGGAVLDLEVRVPSKNSSSSTVGTTRRNNNKRSSEVQSELEILKRKISMLEKSVSRSQNIEKDSQAMTHERQPSYNEYSPNNGQQQQHNLHHTPPQPQPHQQPPVFWSTVGPTAHSNSSLSSVATSNAAEAAPIWKFQSEQMLFSLRSCNPFPPDVNVFSFNHSYVPFISTGNSTARYLPPLCWVSLVRLDNALSPIFWYKKGTIQNRIKYEKPVQPSDKVFQDKFLLINVDNVKYENPKRRHFKTEKIEMVKRFNESAMLVGLTVYAGEIDPNLDIALKVRLLLPTRKVIWRLIDRFFSRIYPFYPLLDQFDFEEQVAEILGSRNDDHVEVELLNIAKKMDIVTCGLLLLVLRLSYLSVISNDAASNEAVFKGTDPSEEGQERTFLMHNPIHIDVIDIAQQCLHYFGYLRYCNLPILQLSIFTQVYQCYAPENGEGYEDITVKGHTSMLVNMAMSLGLHREPSNFSLSIRDPKLNNLCRKIWWYLMILDSHATISSGVQLCTGRQQFDTKPPFYTEGCSNVKDIKMERTVITVIASFDPKYDEVVLLSDLISNLEPTISVPDLTASVNRLEQRYLSTSPIDTDLEDMLAEACCSSTIYEEVTRSIRMKIHFQSHAFLISICFHFFCYFEKLGNIEYAYFYMKKLVYMTLKKMMPFYNAYVDKSAKLFAKTSDIPITPTFQALVHKCMIYLQAILIRLRFSILQCELSHSHTFQLLNNPHYKQRYELFQETWDLTENCLQVFVNLTTKLGSRFYYSWRCTKAQVVLKEIRQGTDYYVNYRKGNECFMLFDNEMLEDLNDLLRLSLDAIAENKTDVSNSTTNALSGVYMDQDTRSLSTVPLPEGASPFDDKDLWHQMIMVKPRIHKSMKYSLTPPTVDYNTQLDFNDIPTYTNDTYFPEQNFSSLGIFENLFNELDKPDF